jgi:hypothetical protein
MAGSEAIRNAECGFAPERDEKFDQWCIFLESPGRSGSRTFRIDTELRSSLSQSHHLIPVDAGPMYREGYLFERRTPNRIARLAGCE